MAVDIIVRPSSRVLGQAKCPCQECSHLSAGDLPIRTEITHFTSLGDSQRFQPSDLAGELVLKGDVAKHFLH